MIRLVLADDHALFRDGLAALLRGRADLELCGVAADGASAWAMIEAHAPDVALLDMRMPDPSGVAIAQRLKRERRRTRALLVTMFKDPLAVRLALHAGVDGYALKDDHVDELVVGIREVASGARFVSRKLHGVDAAPAGPPPAIDAITPREREVLRWIASGWSNAQIAAQLQLSVRTVDAHRHNAMRKLDVHNTADLVRFAIILGFADP